MDIVWSKAGLVVLKKNDIVSVLGAVWGPQGGPRFGSALQLCVCGGYSKTDPKFNAFLLPGGDGRVAMVRFLPAQVPPGRRVLLLNLAPVLHGSPCMVSCAEPLGLQASPFSFLHKASSGDWLPVVLSIAYEPPANRGPLVSRGLRCSPASSCTLTFFVVL